MKVLTIQTSIPYNFYLEKGLIEKTGELIKDLAPSKVCIVTDSNVRSLFGEKVRKSITSVGLDSSIFAFKAGEHSKKLSTVNKIYEFFETSELHTDGLVIALGGGVVGDTVGFAAATYMRGVRYIQIPTTLTAQVDSSIGGKTGVNTDAGKNLIGAFYNPEFVICDPEVLSIFKNINPISFKNGIAELLKHGFVSDRNLSMKIFEEGITSDNIESLIESSLKIKSDILYQDTKYKGNGMIFNFGHTIGHSIEKISSYSKEYAHGDAISIGMAMSVKAGEANGITKPGTYEELTKILRKFNLAIDCDYTIEAITAAAFNDKKRLSHTIRLIMLEEIGTARIISVDIDDIYDFFSKK